MNRSQVGRAIAAVGLVLGFVAIFVDFVRIFGQGFKYSDDGTILAFLLVSLILTAILLSASAGGRDALETAAAVAGSAAFGFYLFVPASFAFKHLDFIDSGGWLGVCSGLIPLGLWLSLSSRPRQVRRPDLALAVPAIVGRVCCIVAIWLTATSRQSYWDLTDAGRALPSLMLLLVIGGAALGAATMLVSTTRVTADGALILAAITFGLYAAEVIGVAFNGFGALGAGAWLGAAGGLVLLVGVTRIWQRALGGAPSPEASTVPIAPPAG